jgi:hypothetical protein
MRLMQSEQLRIRARRRQMGSGLGCGRRMRPMKDSAVFLASNDFKVTRDMSGSIRLTTGRGWRRWPA